MTDKTIPIEQYAVHGSSYVRKFEVAEDGVQIYKGMMVAVNISGYARPAAPVAGLIVVGIAENNAVKGEFVFVRSGLFEMKGDLISSLNHSHINKKAYVLDCETVSATGTNNIVAGVVRFFASFTRPVVEIGNVVL